MAEGKGYDKEIRTILRHSQGQGSGDPVAYMSDVWPKKVNNVIELSRLKVSFNVECNPSALAHTCLSESDGDVERAVALFVTKWNEKVCVIVSRVTGCATLFLSCLLWKRADVFIFQIKFIYVQYVQ